MFSRFDTNHACDGQTDRQTDGIAVAYVFYAIWTILAYNAVERKSRSFERLLA